jgi:hypothetical protein
MSGLHSALKAVKKRTNAIGWHDDGSSGPVPVQTSAPAAAATLEVRAGMSIEDLRYTWRSMVSGGLIDSSWYDIHAVSA